jgi:hypothetical protein
VAAWHHGDTPHHPADLQQARQPRLNDKLSVAVDWFVTAHMMNSLADAATAPVILGSTP